MEKVLLLRPHHLLCLRFFRGYGYSDEFSKNMSAVKQAVDSDEEVPVLLIEGADLLCGKCPNRTQNGCSTQEKVQRYDRRVLHYTHLLREKEYTWQAVSQVVEEKILKNDLLKEICSDCSWYPICAKLCK